MKNLKNRNLDSGGSQVGKKGFRGETSFRTGIIRTIPGQSSDGTTGIGRISKENIVESRRGSGSYICEDAGMLLGNTERRADHEEKRIAVMLTYIDTYIFPVIIREIEKR